MKKSFALKTVVFSAFFEIFPLQRADRPRRLLLSDGLPPGIAEAKQTPSITAETGRPDTRPQRRGAVE